MDWNKMDTHSKVADLVLNGVQAMEGICKAMVKNRSQNPIKYVEQIEHRLKALTVAVTIIRVSIDEKTNQK